ncbi:MAG TPA: universal stress protein [Salinivirgaceae bacterium]|nr:universal stress protein [Salinivirgaceae bacterium]
MKTAGFKILVPIDFSDQSIAGLRQAAAFSKAANAKIVALHVIREHSSPWNLFSYEEKSLFIEKTHEKLRLLADLEQVPSENFSTLIESGKLCDTIIDTAVEINADCIVMGTSAADNIKKKIIGSNALRIVTEATIPVVTVKLGCECDDFSNIILPLDLSKETREKVPLALRMAKMLGSVINVVSFVSTSDALVISYLRRQASIVQEHIEERGVRCITTIQKVETSRKEAIQEYLTKNKGLVIVTTHMQPEIIDIFFGSFASEVIHSSPGPVMSIVPIGVIKYSSDLPGIQ